MVESTRYSNYPWMQLKLLKSAETFYSKPLRLNNKEFIVIPRSDTSLIFKYNIDNNEWSTWLEIEADIDKPYSSVAFDQQNKTLYICYDRSLIIIDTKTKQITTINHSIVFGEEAASIFIHDEFHIVGGDSNGKHYVYNKESKQFHELYEFTLYNKGFSCNELIYLQSKNALLLMGGYDDTNFGVKPLDTIYIYSFSNNQWKEMDVRLLHKIYRYAYSVSKNEQFVVILGDYTGTNIQILDLKTMTFRESKIKIPEGSLYADAITMYGSSKDELLLFGYFRCINNSFGVEIPMDITNIIKECYISECIYLIDTYGSYHLKIKLNHIL